MVAFSNLKGKQCFSSIFSVCHRIEISDNVTMNCFRTVHSLVRETTMLVKETYGMYVKELLVLYRDKAYA